MAPAGRRHAPTVAPSPPRAAQESTTGPARRPAERPQGLFALMLASALASPAHRDPGSGRLPRRAPASSRGTSTSAGVSFRFCCCRLQPRKAVTNPRQAAINRPRPPKARSGDVGGEDRPCRAVVESKRQTPNGTPIHSAGEPHQRRLAASKCWCQRVVQAHPDGWHILRSEIVKRAGCNGHSGIMAVCAYATTSVRMREFGGWHQPQTEAMQQRRSQRSLFAEGYYAPWRAPFIAGYVAALLPTPAIRD